MINPRLEPLQDALRKGVFTGLRWIGHRPRNAIKGLRYGREPAQSLDIYLPADGYRGSQVVFFHGGGWRSGSKDEYAYLGAALAAYGVACAVVGYRLYPSVRYPLFVEDAAHAVSWLRREGVRYGFADGPLFLMGHSAGAHIAALVALDDRYRTLARLDDRSVAGVIGLAGVYRFRPENSPVYRDIFSTAAPNFDSVNPIHYVASHKVPLLMLHGDQDALIGIRNAQKMQAAAQAVGQKAILHAQSGYGHVRPILDFLPFMPNHQKTMSILLSFMSGHQP